MNTGTLYFIYTFLNAFVVIIIHEGIHFTFAKIFRKKNVRLVISQKRCFVEYDNDKRYVSIMIIAIAPSLLMFTIGYYLFTFHSMYLFIFSVFLIGQIVFILPFFSDGRILLACLINLVKKCFRD